MGGYEVDTDRWREHARRVDQHGDDVAGIAVQARAMAGHQEAYGLVLAPLGLLMAGVQQAEAAAIEAVSFVLGVSADAVRAGAHVRDEVDEIVGATLRRALR